MTRPEGFNLADDPWVPFPGRHMSIRGALTHAHQLDGWPGGGFAYAETALRLLAAIAYRLTGLDDPALDNDAFAERQTAALAAGRFDPETVDEYLDRHHNRLWLLGGPPGTTPFAQDPALAPVPPKQPAKAVAQWSSGNNALLGPHADTTTIDPATAAQQLLAIRGYSYGGLHTKHPEHPGQGAFNGAPLRGTMSVHPVGLTLAATLIAHLVPLPGGDTEFGEPFWEQPPPHNPTAPPTSRAGMLEQITGRQDKTMLYHGDSRQITGFTIAEGPGVHPALFCADPYIVHTADGERRKPKPGKAFWRESEGLLADADGERYLTARILDWAADENPGLYHPAHITWAIIAHRGDKSKELEMARHTAPRLLALFTDPETAARARSYIISANDAERRMARQLAAAFHRTGTMPDNPQLAAQATSPARSEFWKLAEPGFWAAAAGDLPPDAADHQLRRFALAGYDHAADRLARNPRTLAETVAARRPIETWPHQPGPPPGPQTGAEEAP